VCARRRRPDEWLEVQTADAGNSFLAVVRRLQGLAERVVHHPRFYDAVGRINGVLGLLVLLALMTPMGLQQDTVDLFEIDQAGTISDRL
jgi:hypothetical protein